MRSRTANWFICKIRYEKVMEDGLQKKVTEQYVVDALSFTEAEARIIEEMSSFISGEFEVVEIDRCVFKEIFFSDSEDSYWYKSKVQFITIDEKTEKEKKSNVYYLVEGTSLANARSNINDVFSGTMIDYKIAGINETSIENVFEFIKKEEAK